MPPASGMLTGPGKYDLPHKTSKALDVRAHGTNHVLKATPRHSLPAAVGAQDQSACAHSWDVESFETNLLNQQKAEVLNNHTKRGKAGGEVRDLSRPPGQAFDVKPAHKSGLHAPTLARSIALLINQRYADTEGGMWAAGKHFQRTPSDGHRILRLMKSGHIIVALSKGDRRCSQGGNVALLGCVCVSEVKPSMPNPADAGDDGAGADQVKVASPRAAGRAGVGVTNTKPISPEARKIAVSKLRVIFAVLDKSTNHQATWSECHTAIRKRKDVVELMGRTPPGVAGFWVEAEQQAQELQAKMDVEMAFQRAGKVNYNGKVTIQELIDCLLPAPPPPPPAQSNNPDDAFYTSLIQKTTTAALERDQTRTAAAAATKSSKKVMFDEDLGIEESEESDEPIAAEFGMLAVSSTKGRQGIGAALIAAAERWAVSHDFHTMRCEILKPREGVHPYKEFLQSWYSKLGYSVESESPFEEMFPELMEHNDGGLVFPCNCTVMSKSLAVPEEEVLEEIAEEVCEEGKDWSLVDHWNMKDLRHEMTTNNTWVDAQTAWKAPADRKRKLFNDRNGKMFFQK